MKLTKNAKRWLELDDQENNARKKVEKYESGYHYDPLRKDTWEKRRQAAYKKQQELEKTLTNEDKDCIEAEYLVGEMFDRD